MDKKYDDQEYENEYEELEDVTEDVQNLMNEDYMEDLDDLDDFEELEDSDDEQSATEKANAFTQRLKKIGNNMKFAAGLVLKIFTNPVTWIGIAGIAITILLMSGLSIFGKSDYNVECLPTGAGVVNVAEDADDFTRQSAIASWLTSTPFDAFGGKPMTKEQAAGVIGNFIVESAGGRPHYVETLSMRDPDYYKTCDNDCVAGWGEVSGKAIGIAQWDSGRRVGLVNFAKDQGKQWYDLNLQLNFLKRELDGTEGVRLAEGGFTELTHTPAEYARLWNRLFERSEGNDNTPHVIKRKEQAEKFASEYTGGGGMATNCTGGIIDTSNIAQLAIQVSWPMGDRSGRKICSTATDCGVDFSKPEYIAAKKLANETTGVDPAAMLLASCDRFVATMYRATGTDPNFPWGAVHHQEAYMEASPDYERISCQDRQPGDIIVEKDKHIMLYVGVIEGREAIASASYMERSASIMPMSCNGDDFNADSYPNAKGWRKVR